MPTTRLYPSFCIYLHGHLWPFQLDFYTFSIVSFRGSLYVFGNVGTATKLNQATTDSTCQKSGLIARHGFSYETAGPFVSLTGVVWAPSERHPRTA